jgi:hypothetical protein
MSIKTPGHTQHSPSLLQNTKSLSGSTVLHQADSGKQQREAPYFFRIQYTENSSYHAQSIPPHLGQMVSQVGKKK